MVSPDEGEPGMAVPAASRLSERWQTFILLVLGAIACCAALHLYFTQETPPWNRASALIVLFGLPYVLRELGRCTNWMLVLYFVLLVPAFHYAAMMATIKGADVMPGGADVAMLLVGSVGGLVGAGLSLLALWLPGLRVHGNHSRAMLAVIALAVLTFLAGLSFTLLLAHFDSLAYTLYLPWQIVFAFFLSRLLPSSPPRRAATPRVE
jgi:hypothetical protein